MRLTPSPAPFLSSPLRLAPPRQFNLLARSPSGFTGLDPKPCFFLGGYPCRSIFTFHVYLPRSR